MPPSKTSPGRAASYRLATSRQQLERVEQRRVSAARLPGEHARHTRILVASAINAIECHVGAAAEVGGAAAAAGGATRPLHPSHQTILFAIQAVCLAAPAATEPSPSDCSSAGTLFPPLHPVTGRSCEPESAAAVATCSPRPSAVSATDKTVLAVRRPPLCSPLSRPAQN